MIDLVSYQGVAYRLMAYKGEEPMMLDDLVSCEGEQPI